MGGERVHRGGACRTCGGLALAGFVRNPCRRSRACRGRNRHCPTVIPDRWVCSTASTAQSPIPWSTRAQPRCWGNAKRRDAVEPLLELLGSRRDPAARAAAARVLGQIGGLRAAAPLIAGAERVQLRAEAGCLRPRCCRRCRLCRRIAPPRRSCSARCVCLTWRWQASSR